MPSLSDTINILLASFATGFCKLPATDRKESADAKTMAKRNLAAAFAESLNRNANFKEVALLIGSAVEVV